MKHSKTIFYYFIILLLLFPISSTEGYSVIYRDPTTQVEEPPVRTKKAKKTRKRRKKRQRNKRKISGFEWNQSSIVGLIFSIIAILVIIAIVLMILLAPFTFSPTWVLILAGISTNLGIAAGIYFYLGQQDKETKEEEKTNTNEFQWNTYNSIAVVLLIIMGIASMILLLSSFLFPIGFFTPLSLGIAIVGVILLLTIGTILLYFGHHDKKAAQQRKVYRASKKKRAPITQYAYDKKKKNVKQNIIFGFILLLSGFALLGFSELLSLIPFTGGIWIPFLTGFSVYCAGLAFLVGFILLIVGIINSAKLQRTEIIQEDK